MAAVSRQMLSERPPGLTLGSFRGVLHLPWPCWSSGVFPGVSASSQCQERRYQEHVPVPRGSGSSLDPAPLEGVRPERCGGWARASLTSFYTAFRVDGKELPPKSWREPKPEYGDFQPVASDPKNPWPACGPRNGLVGPLQGCGKPPGKVGSWGRGWLEALTLWPWRVSLTPWRAPLSWGLEAAGCISGV